MQTSFDPRRDRYRTGVIVLPVVVAAVAATMAVAAVELVSMAGAGSDYVVFVLLALTGLAWLILVAVRPAAALLSWLFVAANVVPGVDMLAIRSPGSGKYSDFLVLLLAAGAVVAGTRSRQAIRSAIPRWLATLAAATIVWWVFTLLRTWVFDGVSLVYGAEFARDLVYAVAVAVFCCIVMAGVDAEALRRLVAGTVAIGCFYAAAHLLTVVGVVGPWLFIHPYLDQSRFYDLPRYYTVGQILVLPALCISAWFALGTTGVTRLVWACAVVLLAVDTAVAFTRIDYIGALIGLGAGLCVVAYRMRFARLRRLAVASAVAVLLCLSLWGSWASLQPPSHQSIVTSSSLYTRIASIGTDLGLGQTHESGTVAMRARYARTMLGVLGPDWPWGLGFLNPQVRYFPEFPQGSIRDTDLGALGGLMVSGAIGVILAFLLPLLVAWWMLTSPARGAADLLTPGLVGYAVAIVVTSVTLVTLFSWDSTPIVGFVLALGIVSGVRARRQIARTSGPR
jgi:hypothetical protein